MNTATSAGVADCFAIKSAGFERGTFGVKNYVIEFYSLCSMSTITEINRFNNTGLTFTANGPQKITSFVSIYNFNNYKTFTFKLGDATSGEYRIQLDLWARSDDSRRTIYLPNLILEDPIDCIKEVSTSGELTPNKETKVLVKLRNNCGDIPNKDFYYSSINLSLDVNGQLATDKIEMQELSGIETTFTFYLSEFSPGTYFPKLLISGYPRSKSLQLASFAIKGMPKPSITPSKISSPSIDFELCSFSKNIEESCSWAPDWYFDFCSVYEVSQLQQKVGSKWVTRKNIKAELNSDSCDGSNPNYFSISGTSTSKKMTLQYRIFYKATKKYKSSFYNFTVKPKISDQ